MSKAQREILKLMNEYCYRIDAGDLDGFAAMFEKGNFEIIGDPSGPMVGSAPVRAMLENVTLYDGKPQSKHVMSNVQIDVDGDSATAQSYVTVMQARPTSRCRPSSSAIISTNSARATMTGISRVAAFRQT
jgi:hypothetical protein